MSRTTVVIAKPRGIAIFDCFRPKANRRSQAMYGADGQVTGRSSTDSQSATTFSARGRVQ